MSISLSFSNSNTDNPKPNFPKLVDTNVKSSPLEVVILFNNPRQRHTQPLNQGEQEAHIKTSVVQNLNTVHSNTSQFVLHGHLASQQSRFLSIDNTIGPHVQPFELRRRTARTRPIWFAIFPGHRGHGFVCSGRFSSVVNFFAQHPRARDHAVVLLI